MDLYSLVLQSDSVTKGIVGLLLLISILNGALIMYKMLFFKRELRSMNRLLQCVDSSSSRKELEFIKKTFFSEETKKFFASLLHAYDETSPINNEKNVDVFESRSYHYLNTLILHCEAALPFLSISAVTSPLIGLFGTVWGLIHAFISISQEKTADLLVVAPGIAEALITTLAGLIVAIPATIFFHYFSNELRKLENTAAMCIDSLARIVQKPTLKEEA